MKSTITDYSLLLSSLVLTFSLTKKARLLKKPLVNEIQAIFIRNLKKLRGKAGLTQAALAEKCALSSYYVTEIETGRRFPSVETLQKLCEALAVRPYVLFFSEEDSLGFLDSVRDELYLGRLRKQIDDVFTGFR